MKHMGPASRRSWPDREHLAQPHSLARGRTVSISSSSAILLLFPLSFTKHDTTPGRAVRCCHTLILVGAVCDWCPPRCPAPPAAACVSQHSKTPLLSQLMRETGAASQRCMERLNGWKCRPDSRLSSPQQAAVAETSGPAPSLSNE